MWLALRLMPALAIGAGRGRAMRQTPHGRPLAVWQGWKAPSKPAGYSDMLATLSDEGRSEVEERAAIMEFDAGLGRDAAERAAFCLYRQAK